MRRTAAIALMLLAAVASQAARAQAVVLEGADKAATCIVLAADAPRGEPLYPPEALQRGESGQVAVRLSFAGPDRAPAAEILHTEGAEAFAAAVLEQAHHWRAPCVAAGARPARADLGIAFVAPERRVVMALPADPDAAEHRRHAECMQPRGGLVLSDYPVAALREDIQGWVLLTARFTAPDQPPVLTARARPRAAPLRQAVLREAQALRMPCMAPGDDPVSVDLAVAFRIQPPTRSLPLGFKKGLGFHDLVAVTSPAYRRQLPASSQHMACPFELRMTYRQPDAPNIVHQQGDFHPARQPMLDWLARISLTGPDDVLDAVYGESVQFQVPCYKIQSTAQANPSTNKE